MLTKKISGPLTKEIIKDLRVGERIFYSGILYTARDQAHKRMVELIRKNEKLPFDLRGQIIYYCGPNPAPKGRVIGSCGPTTSSRMDEFAPLLYARGLLASVGKGERGRNVIQSVKEHRAVYFVTYSGCGALLARYVRRRSLVGFKDLGAEAVYALSVENFPLVVAIDCRGEYLYA